jgi:hypothetical protein
MRKYIIITLSIFILALSILGISYAWFTYLETKALAQFTAGEIDLQLKANKQIMIDDVDLTGLAFIDYEEDLILNSSNAFDDMGLVLRLDFVASANTVAIKNQIELIENESTEGLIYLILFEGVNLSIDDPIQSNYHDLMTAIIQSGLTKEDQLQLIKDYNQTTIDYLETIVMRASESVTIQIVFYGDYDALPSEGNYLDQAFPFTLIINTMNEKGVFQP